MSSPRATEEDRKDESPASWRLGLRKTGSYGALAEITATKESQKEKDAAGVMRSASSPRLSSSVSMDNKDKVGRRPLVYRTPVRSLFVLFFFRFCGIVITMLLSSKQIYWSFGDDALIDVVCRDRPIQIF